jgi:hypothetical protein
MSRALFREAGMGWMRVELEARRVLFSCLSTGLADLTARLRIRRASARKGKRPLPRYRMSCHGVLRSDDVVVVLQFWGGG